MKFRELYNEEWWQTTTLRTHFGGIEGIEIFKNSSVSELKKLKKDYKVLRFFLTKDNYYVWNGEKVLHFDVLTYVNFPSYPIFGFVYEDNNIYKDGFRFLDNDVTKVNLIKLEKVLKTIKQAFPNTYLGYIGFKDETKKNVKEIRELFKQIFK